MCFEIRRFLRLGLYALSWYIVDNPALILTTYRQDHILPTHAGFGGHIPIGEMSALRKLKRRFVLEIRPDDNFIKTIVSPREEESCRTRPAA